MLRKFQKECESSCEYILPDYLGDVKKLISTSARAVPSGQFGDDAETECAGIVAYEIVYLDTENKLSSASFTSDYDFSFVKGSESYIDAYVTTEVSSFGVRLTGPRRMIAKANLLSNVCIMEAWEYEVAGSAFSGEEEPEKITKTVSIESALKGDSIEREYAEEAASLEGVSADEIEVITTNAYVRIAESAAVEGGVNIKGTLVVTAIIRTPDTSVFAIRREIPFDETVSIDGATPDMSPIADATVSSVTSGVSDTENGSQITANVIMELSCVAFYNEKKEIISDAYLKGANTVTEYENIDFDSHMVSASKCGFLTIKIPKSELPSENIKELLALNADFKSLSLKTEMNLPKFTGEILFSGVACEISENGSSIITNLKFTAPCEINVNFDCQIPEKYNLSAKIMPAGAEWTFDADEINIKLWYNLSYSLSESCKERSVKSCECSGECEYKKSASRVSVYYPDESETLFDVAKKFHTSVNDIARDNLIAEPTALGLPSKIGLKKLIIR